MKRFCEIYNMGKKVLDKSEYKAIGGSRYARFELSAPTYTQVIQDNIYLTCRLCRKQRV